MFIVAVLNIIKIYQTRHPDINPRSSGSFSFLAIIILVTVIGVVCLKRCDFLKEYFLFLFSIMMNNGFGLLILLFIFWLV
jgi:hypothetical protein